MVYNHSNEKQENGDTTFNKDLLSAKIKRSPL